MDGGRIPHLIWATGQVVKVADGLTDKRSARARKILPAGALLWAWDADPEFDEPAGRGAVAYTAAGQMEYGRSRCTMDGASILVSWVLKQRVQRTLGAET